MANKLIENALTKATEKKTQLLKLKKADRGEQLAITEDKINRLKRWLVELD